MIDRLKRSNGRCVSHPLLTASIHFSYFPDMNNETDSFRLLLAVSAILILIRILQNPYYLKAYMYVALCLA